MAAQQDTPSSSSTPRELDAEVELTGSPYLIDSGTIPSRRFAELFSRSTSIRDRAIRENARIRSEAETLLGTYLTAARTDLVAESNRIEGYVWTREQAREAVQKYRELLDGPVRALVDGVRADDRVYEVLGLFKAHELAEEWTSAERAPTSHEIRGLHHLIMGDTEIAGRYKVFGNRIDGSELRTAEPFDVARVMLQLSDWWGNSLSDPILTATVVHAWLVHIHPFADGNGRLARVLANLELSRHGYPPLLVRAESDRGEYLQALALSDEGDILPLYELFVRVVRRQVQLMSRPNYVDALIQDRFLASDRDRFRFWMTTLEHFEEAMRHAVGARGFQFQVQGTPTLESFDLHAHFDRDGNGWWATIGDGGRKDEWLLWFGYRSFEFREMLQDENGVYPSIFISRRSREPESAVPFDQHFERQGSLEGLPLEITLFPARHNPVCVRVGHTAEDWPLEWAAGRIAAALSGAS